VIVRLPVASVYVTVLPPSYVLQYMQINMQIASCTKL